MCIKCEQGRNEIGTAYDVHAWRGAVKPETLSSFFISFLSGQLRINRQVFDISKAPFIAMCVSFFEYFLSSYADTYHKIYLTLHPHLVLIKEHPYIPT